MAKFHEKFESIYKDKELLQKRHDFAMELVTLITSQKKHRDRVDGYQLKKNKHGYSIIWHGRDIGLNNMDSSTAYGWCIRNSLYHWVKWAEDVRAENYPIYGVDKEYAKPTMLVFDTDIPLTLI